MNVLESFSIIRTGTGAAVDDNESATRSSLYQYNINLSVVDWNQLLHPLRKNNEQGAMQTTNFYATPDCVFDKEGLEPKKMIYGGGLAGLLASILLNNIGVKSTILETSAKRDVWNSRSYMIVLNERVQQALDLGGCLKDVNKVGKIRNFIYFIDGQTGEKRSLPSKAIGIGLSIDR